MAPPSWIQDAIFYQIFPDRFANGDPANDPPDVQPWGAPPTIHGFQGGDLKGIVDRLDYLTDLGVNAVYLNPIFRAGSNHRYNTSDYLRLDDRLGSMSDFRRLVDRAHRAGIRIVLDGVFNHSGRGFFAFRDLLDRGPASAYRAWYHIHGLPLDAFGEDGKASNYEAWWGMRNLPKFNIDSPAVREYLLRAVRYWTEQGIDGWRLDVPNEIPDRSFWEALRRIVTGINPEAALLGEIWTVGPEWVGPSAFDGLMNYPLRAALLEFVPDRKVTATEFSLRLRGLIDAYPAAYRASHYNLLGSHDTERLASLAGGDARKVKLLLGLLFALPGAPGIYYGDEIGLEGGPDPDCRRAFPWEPSRWNAERLDLVRSLIRLRLRRAELRRGDVRFLEGESTSEVVAFGRVLAEGTTVVIANPGEAIASRRLDLGGVGWGGSRTVADALTGRRHEVVDGSLTVHLDPFDLILLQEVR